MTEHYTVDTGSTLRAWDIYAYTQAVVQATKAGKEIEVDSAVKIGNVYEVKYSIAVASEEVPVVTPEPPAATPVVEEATEEVLDESPPKEAAAVEPPKKTPATRGRSSTKGK